MIDLSTLTIESLPDDILQLSAKELLLKLATKKQDDQILVTWTNRTNKYTATSQNVEAEDVVFLFDLFLGTGHGEKACIFNGLDFDFAIAAKADGTTVTFTFSCDDPQQVKALQGYVNAKLFYYNFIDNQTDKFYGYDINRFSNNISDSQQVKHEAESVTVTETIKLTTAVAQPPETVAEVPLERASTNIIPDLYPSAPIPHTVIGTVSIPNEDQEPIVVTLYQTELSRDNAAGVKRASIPIAKEGTWHDKGRYETVSFTTADLSDVIDNFNNNELGFKPPLWLGHLPDEYKVVFGMGGDPAVGYLAGLYLTQQVAEIDGEKTETKVLMGVFDVTEKLYSALQEKVYPSASGELVRGFHSKYTNEPKGLALYAHVLSPIPFVPDMPPIQTLTHGSSIESDTLDKIRTNLDIVSSIVKEDKSLLVMKLSTITNEQMTTQQQQQPNPQQLSAAEVVIPTNLLTVQDVVNQQAANVTELSGEVQQLRDALAKQEVAFNNALVAIQQLTADNEQLRKERETAELNSLVNYITTSPISEALKVTLCSQVNEGIITKKAVYETITALSQNTSSVSSNQHEINTQALTTLSGNLSSVTSPAPTTVSNPWLAVVERNKAVVASSQSV